MDRSDAQTAAVDFLAQALFLLLRRFPQQPVAVSQVNVCRDLLPDVLVERENAPIGQDFYTHGRARPCGPKAKCGGSIGVPLSTALFARL